MPRSRRWPTRQLPRIRETCPFTSPHPILTSAACCNLRCLRAWSTKGALEAASGRRAHGRAFLCLNGQALGRKSAESVQSVEGQALSMLGLDLQMELGLAAGNKHNL